MPYQRPIFATFALLYCLCLGVISIYANPRSKVHRLFALYNLSLALYNAADYAVFISGYENALWYTRFVSIGGTFMVFYFLRFTYELVGISETTSGKKAIIVVRYLVGLFSLLYLTPLMLKGLNLTDRSKPGLEIPGPLYPIYGALVVFGLGCSIFPLWGKLKAASEIQRKQITYVFAACTAGIGAFLFYFLSVVWKDLPWLYYALEALVGFILTYAIFQYNLLPITVALRRALLVMGIYIGLTMIVFPMAYFAYNSIVAAGHITFVFWVLFFGLVLSLGPIIYARVVRHVSIFHDTSASHLTHELKSPLSAIQSAKLILQDELATGQPNETKVHEYLDIIQRNSDRLEKFVLELLNYQKTGAMTDDKNKERLDLAEAARECVKLIPQAHRIIINKEGDASALVFREGIQQIFTNLPSNALREAPEGSVHVDIRRGENSLHVSVRDQGPGLTKEQISVIFDPFRRTKTSTASKSTGLGLAIAQKWVLQHGGKIWVESPGEGKGSTFHFVLPV